MNIDGKEYETFSLVPANRSLANSKKRQKSKDLFGVQARSQVDLPWLTPLRLTDSKHAPHVSLWILQPRAHSQ